MTIIVDGKTMPTNAVFDALLAAAPDVAAFLAANPGKSRLKPVDFDVAGSNVNVLVMKGQIDVNVTLERDLDLSFMFETCEDEGSFQLVYLGRNGDRAEELEIAGRKKKTLGQTIPVLPAFLSPFADTPITDHFVEPGFSDGKDYVALDLGAPVAALPLAA